MFMTIVLDKTISQLLQHVKTHIDYSRLNLTALNLYINHSTSEDILMHNHNHLLESYKHETKGPELIKYLHDRISS